MIGNVYGVLLLVSVGEAVEVESLLVRDNPGHGETVPRVSSIVSNCFTLFNICTEIAVRALNVALEKGVKLFVSLEDLQNLVLVAIALQKDFLNLLP